MTADREHRERQASLERDRDRLRVFAHSLRVAEILIAQYRAEPDDPYMRELLGGLSERDRAMFAAAEAQVVIRGEHAPADVVAKLTALLRDASALADEIKSWRLADRDV